MLIDTRKEPHNGQPPQLHVVFLHGYGSGGQQMRSHVGDTLGPKLDNAKFYFPNAPDHLGDDDHGNSYYSWFPINEVEAANDNHDNDKAQQIAANHAKDRALQINSYIDKIMKQENISEKSIVLMGFSQGATMAYFAALMREKPVAGVFSLSGGALKKLKDIKSSPPIFLAAGEQEYKPYSGIPQMIETYKKLKQSKIKVNMCILPDQGHDISLESQDLMANFVKNLNGYNEPETNLPAPHSPSHGP